MIYKKINDGLYKYLKNDKYDFGKEGDGSEALHCNNQYSRIKYKYGGIKNDYIGK